MSVVATSKNNSRINLDTHRSNTDDGNISTHYYGNLGVEGQNISDIQANQQMINEYVKLVTQNLQ